MNKIDCIQNLNYNFQKFGKKLLYVKGENPTYFVSQLKKYQKQYFQSDNIDVFYKEAVDMADNFSKVGKLDYANIIYSWTIKNKFLPKEVREYVIQRAYENSEKQNDVIHMLARISELKEMYKNDKKEKYIEILLKEQRLLTRVIAFYSSAKKNYNSVKRSPKEIDTYRYKLATNKVDLAKKTSRQNPKFAYDNLISAREFFIKLGKDKELEFVETFISRLKKEIQ